MTSVMSEANVRPTAVDPSPAAARVSSRPARFALAVGTATLATFVLSAIWYVVWATPYAELRGDAATAAMPWWTVLVELARSAVVAAAVAVAVRRLSLHTWAAGLVFAGAVWIAFPVVLLLGSVVHEGVPPLLAAIHAGDWLVKLVVITLLVQRIDRPHFRGVR
jgi:hypothetical protein